MDTLSWGPPEPEDGNAAPRGRSHLLRLVGVTALAAAAGFVAGHATAGGQPRARPALPVGAVHAAPLHFDASHWEGRSDPERDTLTLTVNVTNGGPGEATLLSVGDGIPGLALERVGYLLAEGIWRFAPTPPFVLQPGQTVGVVVTYRITDCSVARQAGSRLPVRVRTASGVRTVHVGSADPYLDLEQPDVGALVTCPRR